MSRVFCLQKNLRYAFVFGILLVLLAVFFALNLSFGSVKIPLQNLLHFVFHFKELDSDIYLILAKIRLPRTIMACLLGGALALSGYLLQTYFQNPIAGPFVLGISSGAKMCLAAVLVVFVKSGFKVNSWTLVGAAFFGSLLATVFILLITRRIESNASLLVAGIMFGYIASAVTDLIISFADDADVVNLHNWSQGSFSGMSMSDCALTFFVVTIAFALTMGLSKSVNVYQLGENYARSMGVRVRLCRVMIILLSSVFSSVVVAFAGPVSFVGIAVPFLTKQLLGTSKAHFVIPAAFLGGSVFCLFSDLLCRMLVAPGELKIGVVTSFFGAPVVLFMLVKNKWRQQ